MGNNTFTEIQYKKVNKECWLIGRIPHQDTVESYDSTKDVLRYIENHDDIGFLVEPLSLEPDKIAYGDCLQNIRFYSGREDISFKKKKRTSHYYNIEERMENFKKEFSNKLFIFSPTIILKEKGYNGQYEEYHKNLKIQHMVNNKFDKDNLSFECVPRLRVATQQFEEAVKKNTEIVFPKYSEEMDDPILIRTEDRLYYVLDGIGKKTTNHTFFTPSQWENIRWIPLETMKIIEQSIVVDDHLWFTERDFAARLMEEVRGNGKRIGENVFFQGIDLPKQINRGDHYRETKMGDIAATASQGAYDKAEQEFLTILQHQAMAKNLFYEKEDLVNFHTSLKTNYLTILSGMSGTGKTRLAALYAETIGLTINNNENQCDNIPAQKQCAQYIVIPVSPAYTEPADVLGFLNINTGLYMSADTGLVDLLVTAQANPQQLYMVIFDEMNLSQVEHWFSSFISILEMDNPVLQLYNNDNETICNNNQKYRSHISIHSNVVFVGTVNVDETTKDFSDRLLDRANVIRLNPISFLKAREQSLGKKQRSSLGKEDTVTSKVFYNIFKTWRHEIEYPLISFTEQEIEFFTKLHSLINEYDHQKGVNFRILRNIEKYIANIPFNEDHTMYFTKKKAIDLQIKQRILTKIKGHAEQIGPLIGVCDMQRENPEGSGLWDLLVEYATVSDFTISKKEIVNKARAMRSNAYCG